MAGLACACRYVSRQTSSRLRSRHTLWSAEPEPFDPEPAEPEPTEPEPAEPEPEPVDSVPSTKAEGEGEGVGEGDGVGLGVGRDPARDGVGDADGKGRWCLAPLDRLGAGA